MRALSPRGIIAAIVVFAVLGGGAALAYRLLHTAPPAPIAAPAPQAPTPVHTVIGRSVQGRAIDAYAYGTGATHLLFVGGMHGGYEWNAVVLAYDLKAYLDAHPETVPASLTVTVIPSLNVDGVYKVVGKEGPFTEADVPLGADTVPGRVNADGVDLNRNFDCHWQPNGTWRNNPVSAGTVPFSEPESAALRDFILKDKPVAVVFWHSQSGTVYASECDNGILPATLDIMHAYASAAGYVTMQSFDAYPVTGDSEGWLASIGIPAITVELTTHTDVEWNKNLAGITALLDYYGKK
jgi:predicted deacylase